MRLRRFSQLLCGLVVCVLSAVSIQAFAAPEIQMSQDVYCGIYAPGWGVVGTSDSPNTAVVYTEYKWNGSSWVVNWGPTAVTNTIGDGAFGWWTFGPSSPGFYYVQVTIGGQTSNIAYFTVYTSC